MNMVTRRDYDKLQNYYGEIPEFMKKYLRLKILERLNSFEPEQHLKLTL